MSSISFFISQSGLKAITIRRTSSRCQTQYAINYAASISCAKKFAHCISFTLFTGASHLRDTFHRMGLDDQDIVALSGGHTLVTFAI